MSFHRQVTLYLCAALLAALYPGVNARAAEGAHPHHIAGVVGVARHKSKNSEFWGVDYAYTFENELSVFVFYEQVRGEFDINAFGVQVGTHFGGGFKAAIGPGIETKLQKDKNLLLLRLTFGYDWHFDNWSIGPVATYDFIEDESDTVYLGLSVGYGF